MSPVEDCIPRLAISFEDTQRCDKQALIISPAGVEMHHVEP